MHMLQEKTMLQKLGQSFNSAGVALFAKVALVGGDATCAAVRLSSMTHLTIPAFSCYDITICPPPVNFF